MPKLENLENQSLSPPPDTFAFHRFMITNSQVNQVRVALYALLETNAPLGVLFNQFLQDDWVALQLSGHENDGDVIRGNTFLVASGVYCAVQNEHQAELWRLSDRNQENHDRSNSKATDSSVSQKLLELSVVAEYILARLYSEVPLDLNPFLIHFVRVYVQHGGSLRYLFKQLFSKHEDPENRVAYAAGLSSLPVARVLGQGKETKLDLRGNLVTVSNPSSEAPTATVINEKQKTQGTNETEPVAEYDDNFVGTLPIEWIFMTLQGQGLEYGDVLAALRPSGDCLELLDRLCWVLGEADKIELQESQSDIVIDKCQTDTYFIARQSKASRLEALELEVDTLMVLYSNCFYKDLLSESGPKVESATTEKHQYYPKLFQKLVTRGGFSSLQGKIILNLWLIFLQAPQRKDGGSEYTAEDAIDALLNTLCTSLLPHGVTNHSANFVHELVIKTSQIATVDGQHVGKASLSAASTKNSLTSRLVYGLVFRWMEVLGQESGSSEFDETSDNSRERPLATTGEQVRLICLLLSSLKNQGLLEPQEDYVLLYGQLLPYVSMVQEARDLCFSGAQSGEGDSGGGGGGGGGLGG